MRRLALASALALSLFGTTGCLYVNTKIPLDTDLDKTELGPKVGKSSMYSLFWAVAWGDAGTQAAAQQGGIQTITHADREVFVVLLGIYARESMVVYGF